MRLPICEVFKIDNNYFLYDTFSHEYIRVPKDSYLLIIEARNQVEVGQEIPNIIVEKHVKGYNFLTNLMQENDYKILVGYNFGKPEYKYDNKNLKDVIQHDMKHLILEVTSQCNLRCKYCVFSEMYLKEPRYENKIMKDDIALDSIDFFMKQSVNNKQVTLSFYGGEPLLAFELIKKCVNYIKEKYHQKNVNYGLTTNGILLKDDILEFLVKEKFSILVSLDGPKWIHDTGRVLGNNKPTYDIIMNNLMNIKDKYPEFYEKIQFNSVIPKLKYQEHVLKFFKDTFPNNYHSFTDIVKGYDENCAKNLLKEIEKNKLAYSVEDIAYSEGFLKKYYDYISSIEMSNKKLEKSEIIKTIDKVLTPYFVNSPIKLENDNKFWPTGCCTICQRRLFVNIDGDFSPCEKILFNKKMLTFGNIKNGFNYEKLFAFVRKFEKSNIKCNKCWAVRLCRKCWKDITEHDCTSEKKYVYNRMTKTLEILDKNPYASIRFEEIEFS